jgi:spore germination protein YaaH
MAVPPKERETSSLPAGAYDYAALGRHADIITLMTYDYAGTRSGAGAVAPHGPVERAVAYAASRIPPEKINLGLAFYGYDWDLSASGKVRALGHEQAADLADQHGVAIGFDPRTRSATFSYRAAADQAWRRLPDTPVAYHNVTTRSAPPCDGAFPTRPTSPATPRPPAPTGMHEHVVWYEDARSAAARLEIAERYGTGVAAWRLGLEDPGVWPALRRWRGGLAGSVLASER